MVKQTAEVEYGVGRRLAASAAQGSPRSLGRSGVGMLLSGQWPGSVGGQKAAQGSGPSGAEILLFSPFTITESCNDIVMKSHCSVPMKQHPSPVH